MSEYGVKSCLDCGVQFFGYEDTRCGTFWEQQEKEIDIKEFKMSEYRRGVEDALKGFQEHEVWGMIIPTEAKVGSTTYIVEAFRALAEKRAKQLLTKKVTKYVNVSKGLLTPYGYSSGFTLFSSEEAAKKSGAEMDKYVGTYPIEIEEEI